MATILAKILSQFKDDSCPLDLPPQRLRRMLIIPVLLSLLFWTYGQETTINCFTPQNWTRSNAETANQRCKSATLYLHPSAIITPPDHKASAE